MKISHVLSLILILGYSSFAFADKSDQSRIVESLVQAMPENISPDTSTGTIKSIEFLMRVKPKLLEQVKKYGFLNIHYGLESGGRNDFDSRMKLEQQTLGTHDLKLVRTEHAYPAMAEIHAKYGYLEITPTEGKPRQFELSANNVKNGGLPQYGKAIIVFDPLDPSLKTQTSFSIYDSLAGGVIHPLTRLQALEEFQKGTPISKFIRPNVAYKDSDSMKYIEAQYWVPPYELLRKMKEIRIDGPFENDQEKNQVKEFAHHFGIPVYVKKKDSSEWEKDAELSGIKKIGLVYERSTEDLIKDYQTDKDDERNVLLISTLLAERGHYKGLPDELKDAVVEKMNATQTNLVKIALAPKSTHQTKAATFNMLFGREWPNHLSEETLEKIASHLSPDVVRELIRKYSYSPEKLKTLEKISPSSSENFKKIVAVILQEYSKEKTLNPQNAVQEIQPQTQTCP